MIRGSLASRLMFLVRLFAALVLGFITAPLLVIFPLSFSSSNLIVFPPPGWSTKWYETLVNDPIWLDAFKNSMIVGVATAILATVLGTMAALALVRANVRGKAAIMGLLIAPMVVPSVITAVSLYFLFSTFGMLGTYGALILGHTVLAIPFVVITVSSSLQSFDNMQIKAGASLGGAPLYVFRTVTLPQILPGLVSGALFAFATSFDEVVLALFLGSPTQRTLPRQIFSGVRENIDPTIAAVATLLILLVTVAMLSMEWFRSRSARRLSED